MLKAEDIIRRVCEVYSNLESYRDSGKILCGKDTILFKTQFARRSGLRFDWAKATFLFDGDYGHAYDRKSGFRLEHRPLDFVLEALAGATCCVLSDTAKLLMPDVVSVRSWLQCGPFEVVFESESSQFEVRTVQSTDKHIQTPAYADNDEFEFWNVKGPRQTVHVDSTDYTIRRRRSEYSGTVPEALSVLAKMESIDPELAKIGKRVFESRQAPPAFTTEVFFSHIEINPEIDDVSLRAPL